MFKYDEMLNEKDVDIVLVTAEEILKYAEEEFEKAIKTKDMILYRNAVDKAFLSMILAVNSYINRKSKRHNSLVRSN
jgi:hypothetical protein